ncbi:MAG: hypothetical protein NTY14_08740 [Candidatus Omnitrophica bacterium]|nr:hypothetical protein [Candidatus Omnitrophota bacterium]
MLWFLVLGAVIVMQIIIGVYEGWKRSLKLFGIFFAVILIIGIIAAGFKIDPNMSRLVWVIAWGVYLFWLIIYCLTNGYINKF